MSIKKHLIPVVGILSTLILNACSGGTASPLLVTPPIAPSMTMESAPTGATIPSNNSNVWVSNCVSSGTCSIIIPGTNQVAIQVPNTTAINSADLQGNNVILTTNSQNTNLLVATANFDSSNIIESFESTNFSALESNLTSASNYVILDNNVFVNSLNTPGSLLGFNTLDSSNNAAIVESSCNNQATSSSISTLTIASGNESGAYIIVGNNDGSICSYGVSGNNNTLWNNLSTTATGYTSTSSVLGITFYVTSTNIYAFWWNSDNTIWQANTSLTSGLQSVSNLANLSNFPTGTTISAIAASNSGNLYIGTIEGNVYALYNGQSSWSSPLNLGQTPVQSLFLPLAGSPGASNYDVYATLNGSTNAYGITPQQ